MYLRYVEREKMASKTDGRTASPGIDLHRGFCTSRHGKVCDAGNRNSGPWAPTGLLPCRACMHARQMVSSFSLTLGLCKGGGGGGLSDGDSRRARKKSLPPKSCVQIPFTEAQFPNDGTPQDPLALALGLPLPLP